MDCVWGESTEAERYRRPAIFPNQMNKSIIAFLLPSAQITKAELNLFKKLFKSQDVSELIKHERKITELFWRISTTGQAFTYDPDNHYKQTTLFPKNDEDTNVSRSARP